MTIWIDVDEVLLHSITRMLDYINKEHSTEVKEFLKKDRMVYEDCTSFGILIDIAPELDETLFKLKDFYHCLETGNHYVEPNDYALEFYNEILSSGVEFKLLTHSYTDEIAESKNRTLLHFFGIEKDKIIHEKNKYLYVKKGDVIIDDGLHNHDAINDKVGGVIHYVVSHPWNQTNHKYFSGSLSEILKDMKLKDII